MRVRMQRIAVHIAPACAAVGAAYQTVSKPAVIVLSAVVNRVAVGRVYSNKHIVASLWAFGEFRRRRGHLRPTVAAIL